MHGCRKDSQSVAGRGPVSGSLRTIGPKGG